MAEVAEQEQLAAAVGADLDHGETAIRDRHAEPRRRIDAERPAPEPADDIAVADEDLVPVAVRRGDEEAAERPLEPVPAPLRLLDGHGARHVLTPGGGRALGQVGLDRGREAGQDARR